MTEALVRAPAASTQEQSGPLPLGKISSIASDYDLRQVQYNQTSRVISYVTSDWPAAGSHRYNIFYTTGTVGHVKTHAEGVIPRRTQTFIRGVTTEHQLQLIISGAGVGNPYSTREEMVKGMLESLLSPGCLGCVVDAVQFDYVALSWSREVKAKLEAEQKRKRKAEEAEQERKRKAKEAEQERKRQAEENERKERGLYSRAWVVEETRADLNDIVNNISGDVKRLFFLDAQDNHLVLKADGNTHWIGLPSKNRLDSLLRGSRGKGEKSMVDVLALITKPCGDISYYIAFKDGGEFWGGLDNTISEIIRNNTVLDMSLGWKNDTLTYIIKTTKATHWSYILGIHENWFHNVRSFALGPEGQHFILRTDGQMNVSHLPKDQYKLLMKLKKSEQLRGVAFGWSGALVIRWS